MADNLAANLAKFNVKDDRIVSFEGQGLKLDNALTGKTVKPIFSIIIDQTNLI
jgi:hypothetical protein